MSQRESGTVKWFNEKKDLALLLTRMVTTYLSIIKIYRVQDSKRFMKMMQSPSFLIKDQKD